MAIPKYENKPVDTTLQLDLSKVAGKTAVITGGRHGFEIDECVGLNSTAGSGGLGLCFAQGLAGAGCATWSSTSSIPIQ